jgi:hypothetical protein
MSRSTMLAPLLAFVALLSMAAGAAADWQFGRAT